MEIPRNEFKRALAASRVQIGLWSNLASNISAEIIAGAGFDWVLIDLEHGPSDLLALVGQMQAFNGSPTQIVVRVPWNDPVFIKRVLDAGAPNILVPMVQNAEEARRAVAATRYPPAGIRGAAGGARASRYGRVKDYFARANDEIGVLVQVESIAAIGELDAITAVEGVDGVFIGPADLAGSMGKLTRIGDGDVQSIVTDAVRRIRAQGKAPGFITQDGAQIRQRLAEGVLFMAVGTDAACLVRATDQLVAEFKGARA